jgi:hypothetical protein
MWVCLMMAVVTQHDFRIDPPAKLLTAGEVVGLAVADQQRTECNNVRYIAIPEWLDAVKGKAAADFVLNSTLSRTSNLISSEVIAGGRLLRIDLERFAVDPADLTEILGLWELFAAKDSYFHIPAATLAAAKTPEVRIGTAWKPCKVLRVGPVVSSIEWEGKPRDVDTKDLRGIAAATFAPLPGLLELAAATGSQVPILRLEEFVAFAFSSVNGGLYYRLLGAGPDLKTTIEKFAGKDAAAKLIKEIAGAKAGRLDPALSQSRALVLTSNVTGRQRLVQAFYGANGVPSVGPQVVSVTLDVAEDNTNPESDPLRNLRDYRGYDGGEVIFSLPNGLLAYLVTDNNDRVIDSVPDRVAHDFRAREVRSNVATTRVFSGASCANCHEAAEKNYGWQPVKNDAAVLVARLGQVLDDASARDRRRALQELAAQYGGKDLEKVLDQSRLPLQSQTHALTGVRTSREVVQAISDLYWGYWYDRVTPTVALRDLGQGMPEDKAQAELLKIKPAEVAGSLVEDAVLVRLKDGEHVTPVQWRSVLAAIRQRYDAQALEVAP